MLRALAKTEINNNLWVITLDRFELQVANQTGKIKMSITMRVVAIFFCFILTLMTLQQTGAAIGQGTGKVKGVLLDHTDARIVHATITFENEKLTGKAYPNDEGAFEISLPAGFYQFSVQSRGFKTFKIDSLEINADTNVEIKAHLEIGPLERPHSIEGVFAHIEPQKAPIGEKINRRKIP
jgi:hypothetical protein